MREKPLRVVRRVGRPVRKALNGLKAILDEHLGRDAQRQVDSIMCRPATSGDAVAAKLDCVYAMRPELHEAFPEGPQSDAFWWWANIHGIFEHDELQFSLPPIPPIRLVRCFSYEKTCQNFAWTGTLHYSIYQKMLKKHGLSFSSMKTVLDFGCGAARLGRLFAKGAGNQRYIGCDLEGRSIHYLQRAMGFGEFHLGFLEPPLPFPEASLDAIFSLSVLTHLNEAAMHRWLAEFHRVLKPGGALLQTTLGRTALFRCESVPFGWRKQIGVSDASFAQIQRKFAEAEFGWAPHSYEVRSGNDYGIAIQSEQYIAKEWTKLFDLIEVVPAAIDDWQDLALLRKPMGRHERPLPPVMPTFAPRGLPAPERVVLHAPVKAALGGAVKVQAAAIGGADVCFRFAVQQNNWQPLLTEWQREPSTTFFATAPGLFHLRVEAASGSGYHMAAPVVADADLIVEASVSAS